MCKKTKEHIQGEKKINTFIYLKKASQLLLEEANENPEGSGYKYMTSMLNTAFYLEAYLNHLGKEKKYKIWDSLEKLSPLEKLKVIADIIDYQIDDSRRPFQTFKEIFKFRNSLVHGKTEAYRVNEVKKIDVEKPTSKQIPESEWKSEKSNWKTVINKKTAERFFEDATKIIEMLHAQAGLPETDLNTFEWSEISSVLQTKDN
jgi:hypothetical protein